MGEVSQWSQYFSLKGTLDMDGAWEICMQVRKQQLELDMEQQTGSK